MDCTNSSQSRLGWAFSSEVVITSTVSPLSSVESSGTSRGDGGGGASPGEDSGGGDGELRAFLASLGLEHVMPAFTNEEV